MKLKTLVAALAVGFAGSRAFAQAPTGPVRIGFVTDMSGIYSDLDGPNGLEAIRMAVADATFRRELPKPSMWL